MLSGGYMTTCHISAGYMTLCHISDHVCVNNSFPVAFSENLLLFPCGRVRGEFARAVFVPAYSRAPELSGPDPKYWKKFCDPNLVKFGIKMIGASSRVQRYHSYGRH